MAWIFKPKTNGALMVERGAVVIGLHVAQKWKLKKVYYDENGEERFILDNRNVQFNFNKEELERYFVEA